MPFETRCEIQGRNIGIIHCDIVNSRSHLRGERQKGARCETRRFFGFFQKPDVAGALMGHASAFTRKLWKSTVTICEARLNQQAETAGRAEGKGRSFHRGFRVNVEIESYLRCQRYIGFFHLHSVG